MISHPQPLEPETIRSSGFGIILFRNGEKDRLLNDLNLTQLYLCYLILDTEHYVF